MKVTALFFGHFRDYYPEGLVLEIPDGSTTADLAVIVATQDSRLNAVQSICRAAVDEEYVPSGTVLRPGDTVAFIPPMSGGTPER